MAADPAAQRVADYVHEVMAAGPEHPAFDGRRVFFYPERLRHFLTGKPELIVPVTVEVWPSLSCNARCPTCPFRVSGARRVADRSAEMFLLNYPRAETFIRDLADEGAKSIILTGGGEPLLHPKLLEIVDVIRENGLPWALFTNGILLSAAMARELLSRKPRFLRVSVDAGDPDLYNATYAASAGTFEQVVANVEMAARIAAEMGSSSFGVSFSLSQDTKPIELDAIRRLLIRWIDAAPGGIHLAAFRPRVVHYKGSQVLCPQPRAVQFLDLAAAINDVIVQPVYRHTGDQPLRVDLKYGLFVLAAASELTNGSFGSGWMTNIDHTGDGYITTELAGYVPSGQRWGTLRAQGDFSRAWFGDARTSLYRDLALGCIPVPVAHRTSPIDAMLHGILQRTNGPVDERVADAIIARVHTSVDMRPSNVDFF